METTVEIKSISGNVLFSYESEGNSIRKTLEKAVEAGVDLSGANLMEVGLSGANLREVNLTGANLSRTDLTGANLSGANLKKANFSGAYLSGANLTGTNLLGANLRGVNLRGANLSGAYLSGADLSETYISGANLRKANFSGTYLSKTNFTGTNLLGANLRGTNLRDANLSGTYLSGADLRDANIRGVNLSWAYLSGADLSGAYYNEVTSFFLSQCPSEGSFIAWKKASEYVVKLRVTENAKRSSATTLKCRCSEAEVLDIQDLEGNSVETREVKSNQDSSFVYRVGEIVKVDDFDEDRWNECSTGIHFFISREMAVKYN